MKKEEEKEEEDKEEDEEEDYDINDHEEDDFTAPAEEKKEDEQKYDEATQVHFLSGNQSYILCFHWQGLIATAEAARKAFNDADRAFRDTEREIKNLKDVLEKDFGEEHEFSVLNGQCFEYTDNEYKWELLHLKVTHSYCL